MRPWLRAVWKSPIPVMVALALGSGSVTLYALSTQRAPTPSERLHRSFAEKPNMVIESIKGRMRR